MCYWRLIRWWVNNTHWILSVYCANIGAVALIVWESVQCDTVNQGRHCLQRVDIHKQSAQLNLYWYNESTAGVDASMEAVPKAIRHEATRSKFISVQHVGNDRPWLLLKRIPINSSKSIKLLHETAKCSFAALFSILQLPIASVVELTLVE